MHEDYEFTDRVSAHAYMMRAFRWGADITGFTGMSNPGSGEMPKGFFARGQQTEYGVLATANRIYANVCAAGRDPWTGLLDTESLADN